MMNDLSHGEQNKDAQQHYKIIARAIEFIRNNAQQQPTLKEIANTVNLSEYHLQQVFTAWAGVSPKRFLQFITKERALQELKKSKDVLNAALDCGLSGAGRLHDLLVSCEAMTPGEIKAQGKGLSIGYGKSTTPFGDAIFGWTPRGLCHLEFCDGDFDQKLVDFSNQWTEALRFRDDEKAKKLSMQIFNSNLEPGKLHLVIVGTNFQLKVWQALLNTDPAQVISYGQLAQMSGSPNAQRAVGSALGANKIGYLIPCHRVIRGDGEAGHYRWGNSRKLAIQSWEASHLMREEDIAKPL